MGFETRRGEESVATYTILIVEERGTSKAALESLVPLEDFSVTCVPGYIEALYKISKEHFDVVLASQSMSEMSGIELLTAAKSLGFVETLGKGTRPVFILFCDSSDESIIRQAWATGFRHVVSKSITRKRFTEILSECLGPQEKTGEPVEKTGTDSLPAVGESPESATTSSGSRELIKILHLEEDGDSVIYHLSGNLSKGSGYKELHTSVLKQVRETKRKRIILNCQGITYVNSSGITGLVSLRNEVVHLGAEFVVTDAQEQVFNVLARLDLLQTLQYRPAAN